MKRNGKPILVYFDPATRKTVRQAFNALGANTADQRKLVIKRKKIELAQMEAEILQLGGAVGFDTNLLRAVESYLKEVDQTRSSGGKALKPASLAQLTASIRRFVDWLRASGNDRIKTGSLDAKLLRVYFSSLGIASESARAFRPATIDKHRRNIRTCLIALNLEAPPLFRNFMAIKKGLMQEAGHAANPKSFQPSELKRVYAALKQRDGSNGYQARLFLMLALTGARLGDVLSLTWSNVDVSKGILLFDREDKGGRTRKVSLDSQITHLSAAKIAPTLAKRLRVWKGNTAVNAYVLNGSADIVPKVIRYQWGRAGRDADLPGFSRHDLRRNFTSYAASLGFPSEVAAQLQGHSTAIAEKHYREQLTPESSASTMEEAMGLTQIVKGA